ncbi:hypothetical protein BDV34DRAFT_76485 [Aspergillus parasiticus]|uniref:Uncharacterized protein n=1 Tax=Aspergillus parasiticus TaxID=5067 RepID=A0A5N6DS25_ASPPA|nr:hypothetical protein BDV34DRAFT_76485 [Aspergillus parasiticus]
MKSFFCTTGPAKEQPPTNYPPRHEHDVASVPLTARSPLLQLISVALLFLCLSPGGSDDGRNSRDDNVAHGGRLTAICRREAGPPCHRSKDVLFHNYRSHRRNYSAYDI